MLDTSRHFYAVRTVLALIGAAVAVNLNVLHWNLVDDQSWPLPTPFGFIANASWSAQERYLMNGLSDSRIGQSRARRSINQSARRVLGQLLHAVE